MILALGERGGDLLDRLEEASAETTRAVLDASERLTTSLNFKTGHVHEEFVDLADRVHEMLTSASTASHPNSSNALPPLSMEFQTAPNRFMTP